MRYEFVAWQNVYKHVNIVNFMCIEILQILYNIAQAGELEK